MAEDYYNSPGSAAFDALHAFMKDTAVERRQALLDSIAQKREDRLAQSDKADLEFKKEQLAALKESRTAAQANSKEAKDSAAHEKEIADLTKEMNNMLPGDFVTPVQRAKAARLGVSIPMQESGQAVIPASRSVVQLPQTPVEAYSPHEPGNDGGAVDLGKSEPPVSIPLAPDKYAGNAAQRERGLDTQKIEELLKDPNLGDGVRHYLQVRAALPKGENPPAQLFEKPPVDPEAAIKPVYRITRGGKMEQIGEAPQGAHFSQEPAPPAAPSVDHVLVQTPDGYKLRSDVATTLQGGGTVPLPLTSSTRTMEEGAKMLQPHITRLEATATELDKQGLFGPVMSRIRGLLTKVGTLDEFQNEVSKDPELSKDRLVGQFATSLGLLATGAGRVHGGARGGGSPQMLSHFKALLSDASSLQMFLGRMDSLNEYMSGYAAGPEGAHAGGGETTKTPTRTRKFNPTTGQLE